jgi:four helix bundle protein
MSQSYRDLIVWQKGMDLVTVLHKQTRSFPKEELFALSSQMRRAAMSIPFNIAEGQGRISNLDFRHFLSNALGSLMEVETALQVARNLGYLDEVTLHKHYVLTAEIGRLLNVLIASINRRESFKKKAKGASNSAD